MRLRIRTLMIAVAVVGITSGSISEVMRLGRISRAHAKRARECFAIEAEWRNSCIRSKAIAGHERATAKEWRTGVVPADEPAEVKSFASPIGTLKGDGLRRQESLFSTAALKDRVAQSWERSAAHATQRAEYWAALGWKYKHAAWRPWMSVSPDPPSPP
jgi:hypothetical protein